MIKKYWKHSLVVLLVLLIGSVGYYIWAMYNSLNSLQKPPDQSRFAPVVNKLPKPKEVEPPKWEGSERVNILLLGGDSRGMKPDEVPRSDSLLLASFDPATNKAHLFSILRDTYVDIPGFGQDRINAALAYGGPELAMKTVGNLTGLDVQYYVYTDFQGFIQLIDAIGGVEFDVEKDMKYTSKADNHEFDINLKKGKQILNGETALMYVRFRYDAMSDFARTKRQRELLTAVATKLKSAWSIIQLPTLINKVSPYVETNLTADDLIKLAALGYDSTIGPSHQLPPMDNVADLMVNQSAVLQVLDKDRLKQYIQDALNDKIEDSASGENNDNKGDTSP
ncbi:LCP family protein [Paenibacillus dendritiformis]|uniref:Cell envelope-related transcriptional attenuator n=1 Tax=Paenibacillus dendritiformis C454 TaxID=1131935 RepID=H3SAM6_9BACL|nr:LCP family protein [Paenibacillus dendritiformis]EHQ63819.1 cell envelope-related transcriptional attenuator [Paenibacillus dendritiformis C454]CAH8768578.1 LCP family protein [Paenibacillus dendritiformis]